MDHVFARLRRALLVVAAFSLGINLLMLTVPVYTLQVYDRVLSSGSAETLLMLTVVAGGLLLICTLLDAVRSRLLVRVAAAFEDESGVRAFAGAEGGDDRSGVNTGSRSLADVETVRSFVAGAAMRSLFDLPWTPLWLGLLFLLHPWIGAVALAGAVTLALYGRLGDIMAQRAEARARSHDERARRWLACSGAGGHEVEAMGLRPNLRRLWRAAQMSALADRMIASGISVGMAAGARGLRQALQIAVLAVGALLALNGAVTPGVMVAASLIMARALAPIEALCGQWRSVAAARAAYRRVLELPNLGQSSVRMTPAKPRGELRVDSLIVSVPSRQAPVLTGVGFTLGSGEILGVMGRTGAGKSTLLQTLVGLRRPRWGMVCLDGADLQQWLPSELGEHVGYLSDDLALLEGTIAQNISRHGEVDTSRVIGAARRAGVHELLVSLPDGYNTPVLGRGQNLSAGQRHAVALARALFGEPALVVLDEPAARTDFAGDRMLISLLQQLKADGVTTVIATRQPSLLACADKLLLLDEGRMELFGDRDHVMAQIPRLAPPRSTDRVTQSREAA